MRDQTWKFKSSSGPGEYETQLRAADGRLSCNCLGWTRLRGDVRECKHTKRVEAELAKTGLIFQVVGDARHAMTASGRVPTSVSEPPLQNIATTSHAEASTVAVAARESAENAHGYYAPMSAETMPSDRCIADYQYPQHEWLMQEKYDGVRVTVRVTGGQVRAWSRPRNTPVGKTRVLHPRIVETLSHFADGYYDGELMVPGGRSTDVAVLENAESLYLMLFDVIEGWDIWLNDVDDGRYARRYDALVDAFADAGISDDQAGPVRRAIAYKPTQERYDQIIADGGEGVILKRARGLYHVGQRSNEWLKVKARFEDTFVVIGFEAGLSGPYSVLLLARVGDGAPTQVKTLNREWLRRCEAGEICPGTLVEVEHYGQMLTRGFRHPMVKRIVGEE